MMASLYHSGSSVRAMTSSLPFLLLTVLTSCKYASPIWTVLRSGIAENSGSVPLDFFYHSWEKKGRKNRGDRTDFGRPDQARKRWPGLLIPPSILPKGARRDGHSGRPCPGKPSGGRGGSGPPGTPP